MLQPTSTPHEGRPRANVQAADKISAKGKTKTVNRQLIIEAARKVFAELGYGGATIRDIIRATPFAAGTFYNYFKTKEDVLLAIQDEATLQATPRLRKGVATTSTAQQFLLQVFSNAFEVVASEDGANYSWINLNVDVPAQKSRQFIATTRDLKANIEAAIARGVLPPIDADLLQKAITGAVQGLGENMLAHKGPSSLAAAEFLTALFVGGIESFAERSNADAAITGEPASNQKTK